jgi:hypothetical protein
MAAEISVPAHDDVAEFEKAQLEPPTEGHAKSNAELSQAGHSQPVDTDRHEQVPTGTKALVSLGLSLHEQTNT